MEKAIIFQYMFLIYMDIFLCVVKGLTSECPTGNTFLDFETSFFAPKTIFEFANLTDLDYY